ncbi:homeobox domain-containing protein [Sansalvadorimonas verongulae]|nr:homeobox domain-containing protein [Sansalvadorimonas verongulae]
MAPSPLISQSAPSIGVTSVSSTGEASVPSMGITSVLSTGETSVPSMGVTSVPYMGAISVPSTGEISASGSGRSTGVKRKARTVFTPAQMADLEATFRQNVYLNPLDRYKLAERTGLTDTQIKTWFQNRRLKVKKEQLRAAGHQPGPSKS